MIIVSQDKERIVNFDNVSCIEICPPFDDTQKFEIDAEKVNGELIELGIYETEKRAKEVLIDIYSKVVDEKKNYRMPED